MERQHSWKRSDADEAEGGGRCLDRRQPVQVPEQDQLIEQVVLEPEHNFFELRGPGESGVPAADHREQRICRSTGLGGEVLSAQRQQVFITHSRWNRALVERIGPDREFAPHARSLE